MGNASARDWDPIIGKRFNPLETVNTHKSKEYSRSSSSELMVAAIFLLSLLLLSLLLLEVASSSCPCCCWKQRDYSAAPRERGDDRVATAASSCHRSSRLVGGDPCWRRSVKKETYSLLSPHGYRLMVKNEQSSMAVTKLVKEMIFCGGDEVGKKRTILRCDESW